jgi:hypothetical protein
MGMGGQRHAPAALPPGKTQYPLYRRLGGPQSRSGRVRKISPPQGFDPRTDTVKISNKIPQNSVFKRMAFIGYTHSTNDVHRTKMRELAFLFNILICLTNLSLKSLYKHEFLSKCFRQHAAVNQRALIAADYKP